MLSLPVGWMEIRLDESWLTWEVEWIGFGSGPRFPRRGRQDAIAGLDGWNNSTVMGPRRKREEVVWLYAIGTDVSHSHVRCVRKEQQAGAASHSIIAADGAPDGRCDDVARQERWYYFYLVGCKNTVRTDGKQVRLRLRV